MSTKKENILKRLGDYLDTMFTETPVVEAPVVEAAAGDPPVETPPVEEPMPAPKELKVGDPLPDGEYEVMDQIVVLKGGVIESVTPKEMPEAETEEEMAKKKKAKCDEEEAVKAKLSSDFESKLAAQKAEFELKLKELSEAKQASGIIQAPVEKVEQRAYTAKEIILRNIENRNQ
jgi:hypothetical protein